jgi:hypothetical protein
MSILLYHYKQLTECISEVEQIGAKVNKKKRRGLTIKGEEEKGSPPQQSKLFDFYKDP